MADATDSTLRTCKHCKIEKQIAAFVKQSGGRGYRHKCKECSAADRRALYARRGGQYADHDSPEKKQKRKEAARSGWGRYVWDPSWLDSNPTKECGRCKIELPANPAWFRTRTNSPSGLQSWCKACEARHYDENRAKRNARQRDYWRRRMESDPEGIRANRQNWQERNRDKCRASYHTWREQNLEVARKKAIAGQAKRRAAKIGAGGTFTPTDVKKMVAAQKGKCWYCSCKLDSYHVEHRIPLARGGTNGLENLVLACPPCNLSKGTKMPWEMKNARLL